MEIAQINSFRYEFLEQSNPGDGIASMQTMGMPLLNDYHAVKNMQLVLFYPLTFVYLVT